MIAGFAGQLVSEGFLEQQIRLAGAPDASLTSARRRLGLWRAACSALGPASSVRAIHESAGCPLLAILGLGSPRNESRDAGTFAVTARGSGHPVTFLTTAWGERLDPRWRPAVTQAMGRGTPWCLVFNGTHLRIVDARRLFARRYAEFDLALAADDERAFQAFLLVVGAATSLQRPGHPATDLEAMVDASRRESSAVCRSLKDGVLTASAEVLAALLGGSRRRSDVSVENAFEQSLTIVYRIVFLLFAEARDLVPLWHRVYRDSYSIDALRAAVEQPGAGSAAGLWDTLRAIARLAHAGCGAGDLRVTPFNGRLFAPARTPLAERLDLDDEAARRALLALSTRPTRDRAGYERIAYRDLGVEQLGAVYETLLDYAPRKADERGSPRGLGGAVTLAGGTGIRKATGTFYTPQPIAEFLVRRTLAPLVRDRSPDDVLRLRVVDPAMGSGAFLVSACRYLAAAYESALVRHRGYHAGEFDERDRAAMRRIVAERCLYGVDLNPMAVQLARLSLWLTTLAADRPLTFLDHHLAVGDSLLGAQVADLRRPPSLLGRRRHNPSAPSLFAEDDLRLALKDALPVRFTLETVPDDSLEQVRAKERALAALNLHDTAIAKWRRVANLWCASWFLPSSVSAPASAFRALADIVLTGRGPLPGPVSDRYLEAAERAAEARRFFHWELEFPEAFFDEAGARLARAGFDAVLGNPPWDMIRADSGPPSARSRSRAEAIAVARFARDSSIYAAQSTGHANRYQLFLERAIGLTRVGGRIGLVLPFGLATDHGSAALRRRVLRECDVDALVGLDNRRRIFPVHRSVRFMLLTASCGTPTRAIACRFGEDDPAALESVGETPEDAAGWFPVSITPALVERISGDTFAIPAFRTGVDVSIVERAAALFPPLGSARGWHARFGRELNATDDRDHFRPPGIGLPIIQGKQIEAFRCKVGSASRGIAGTVARRLLPAAAFERPRLGYRDVAGASNRRTLIAAILPGGCVSTHTVFCLRTPSPLQAQHFLCGLFNSFVLDYLIRLRVSTHVTTAMVENLPVPQREDTPGAFAEIAAMARLLGRRSDPVTSARLQAAVARIYQLDAAEFAHILDTFPLVPSEERRAALEALRQLGSHSSDAFSPRS
jgi:hypothetical protein